MVDGLRRRGIEVERPQDLGFDLAADEEHLAYARPKGPVFVTHDADFLRLHQQGVTHAGIVYCAQRSAAIGSLIAGLLRLADAESRDMAGVVEFL